MVVGYRNDEITNRGNDDDVAGVVVDVGRSCPRLEVSTMWDDGGSFTMMKS